MKEYFLQILISEKIALYLQYFLLHFFHHIVMAACKGQSQVNISHRWYQIRHKIHHIKHTLVEEAIIW